ncbi:MAG TPA: NADH-quinone oxidoreductase subunit J [Anaerolineales bacterium]|nr:NADH-quinone oxidoreductase subunit J [Anaerolineales bacterium]
MNSDLIVFLVLSLVAVTSALGMLVSSNAVYSALYLVLNFITVAVFYLLLGAPLIAMSQITIYAGAIMVLFVFIIMLLGTDTLPRSNVLPWQKPLALLLSFILVVQSVFLIFSRARHDQFITAPDASVNTTEHLRELAMSLFENYLLPFEVTSILLLVAMIGVIALTKREKAGSK